MHLAGGDGKVQSFEDFLATDGHVQIFDLKHDLTHRTFQRDANQLLRFHREFHRQLLQHFLAEAVDDQRHRFFRAQPARLAIEKLVFGDFGGGGFVFDAR